MLGVLLVLYIIGREAPEPRVPPPPPLPVLVGAKGRAASDSDFLRRFVFGTTPLFDTGTVADDRSISALTTDPDVVKELEAWAAAARPSERLELRFDRITYDDIFALERRAIGTLTIEGPHVRVETRPTEVPRHEANSARRTRRGVSYRVTSDDGDLTTWDGTRVEISPNLSGTPIRFTSLPEERSKSPFAHAPIVWLRLLAPFQQFDPVERGRNFRVEFGAMNKPGTQIHLVMHGRSREWNEQYSVAEVILRAETYEPMAIRSIDPTGSKETVYVFSDIRRE